MTKKNDKLYKEFTISHNNEISQDAAKILSLLSTKNTNYVISGPIKSMGK